MMTPRSAPVMPQRRGCVGRRATREAGVAKLRTLSPSATDEHQTKTRSHQRTNALLHANPEEDPFADAPLLTEMSGTCARRFGRGAASLAERVGKISSAPRRHGEAVSRTAMPGAPLRRAA